MTEFTDQQKRWLEGFTSGLAARKAASPPVASAVSQPIGPDALQHAAQDRTMAAGGKLVAEEKAKRQRHPLDRWDEVVSRAEAGQFPKGVDVFLTKYHGLFYVAPAEDSFMCRLRIPNGILSSGQMRGLAEAAESFGGGYADVTTRANLQIREIGPRDAPEVPNGLVEIGLTSRGSGADNIRNVTASPTAGIDAQELLDTLPLAKEMHHYILNHRELYGLPRKFNIALDGGGKVSALDDTNDIGFQAVRVSDDQADETAAPGVYFRLRLGGITGHRDFARDTGVLLRRDECVPVAAAIVRVFIAAGDRTDRKKARLKYVLDEWGFDRFLRAVERELGRPLRRVALDRCDPPAEPDRWGHVGVHAQRQPGRCYIGVVLPVGRVSVDQMDGLAAIAERYGSGVIRLTVWQNLLISDVPEADVPAALEAIEALGLGWRASSVRAGLVACTGSAGCKYAGADTKGNAQILARYLDERLALDQPVNIHFTGCHHSCAQHYIGDIGLEATRVEAGDETVAGYHLCVGGGWGEARAIGRRIVDALPFDQVPPAVERLLRHYLAHRRAPEEPFAVFARRQNLETLRGIALESSLPAPAAQPV